MQLTIPKVLAFLTFIFIAFYVLFKPSYKNYPIGSDAAICAALPQDPSTLPFVSYSTKAGFDECVARCMTNVMLQVCPQLPDKSNIFSTRPEVKQQMLDGCVENIKHFVTNSTRCPYLKCQP